MTDPKTLRDEFAMAALTWREIDSAPKDGTIVLLAEGRRIMSGFLKYYPQHGSWNWCIIQRSDGSYSSANGAGFTPRHWMPLPELPDPALARKRETEE